MKDLLYAILAVISAVVSIGSMYSYIKNASTAMIIVALIFAVLAVAFGVMFFLGKVSKREEIHITE